MKSSNYKIIPIPLTKREQIVSIYPDKFKYALYKKEPIARTLLVGAFSLGIFPLCTYLYAFFSREIYMPGWSLFGMFYDEETAIEAKVLDEMSIACQ